MVFFSLSEALGPACPVLLYFFGVDTPRLVYANIVGIVPLVE